MWGDYRGSKPASEMGPPAKTPSATIRPDRRHHGEPVCLLCAGGYGHVLKDDLSKFTPEGFASSEWGVVDWKFRKGEDPDPKE